MLRWIRHRRPFDPDRADEDGLVAVGGSLSPQLLIEAYRSGVFPWSSDPVITWWSPDPRAVFELDSWKPSRSIRRSMRSEWRCSVDESFSQVIRGCAGVRVGSWGTWITSDFIEAYEKLHRMGHAHSVEVWDGRRLVGGLYGVTLGGLFGGESMFHIEAGASKAAILYLVERLRGGGFTLLDAQVPTEHLARLGAVEIPRAEYLMRLREALAVNAGLGPRVNLPTPGPRSSDPSTGGR